MPYPANKFNKLQESRRPDKRSASGDFAFVIRLNPGMIARISIKISDEQRSLRSQSLIRFGQLEQTQQLKTDLGGDMVNYRAAFNSFNLQFIIVCHLYFPLQYQIAIQNQCQ